MKITSLLVVSLGAALLFGACSDDDDSGGGGSSASAVFQEICAGLDDCCKAAGKPNNVSSCVAFYTAFTGGKAADPAKSQVCINQIKAARAAGTFCSREADDSACEEVFSDSSTSGTKQPGEPCSESSECAKVEGASRVYCSTTFTSGPDGSKQEQFCQASQVKKEGEDCQGAPKGYSWECDEKAGAFCDFASGKCMMPAGEGAACSTSNYGSCTKGLYCSSKNGSSVCTPRQAAGAACQQYDRSCAEGTYCSTQQVCETQIADGAACTSNDSCLSGFCTNGACEKSGGGSGNSLCFQ